MIWIVAGTKDAREIIENLIEMGISDIIVTTATEYGKKLLEDKNLCIIDKKLEINEMKTLISDKKIRLIIDASHPYAVNVSENVINAANELGIIYFRFERKMLEYKNGKKFINLKELKEYIEKKYFNKNIMSTLGSNNLSELVSLTKQNNIYIRILPTTTSIEKAEALGFLPNRIIAIQGPISKNMNKVMLEDYHIDILITKESGKTGGELEKVEACVEKGIDILVLARPKIDYPLVFNNINELLEKVKKVIYNL